MEHIKPAMQPLNEQTLKEISSQDFQKVLRTWFEEKGILTDLQAYVKYQMVNVLKNTVIGKNIIKNSFNEMTLSKQAMHLVVAEYLMQNNCYYSLSIFSNEVNITNILPERSIFDIEHLKNKIKFSMQNLTNILELIGISRNSETFKELLNLYFGNNEDATILSCLLHTVCTNDKTNGLQDKEDEFLIDEFISTNENFRSIARYLLTVVPPKLCYDILNMIKKSVENQRIDNENYYSKLISELNKELSNKDKKIEDFGKVQLLLEKKIQKTAEEHLRIKQKIINLRNKKASEKIEKDSAKCILRHCSDECGKCLLNHCMEDCNKNKELLIQYKSDTQRLKECVENQKTEINRLNVRLKELIAEFSVCQNKINLLNTKIIDENKTQLGSSTNDSHDSYKGYVERSYENQVNRDYCASPPSITEDILQDARLKLKQLERESLEIDSKFRNYLIA